MKTQTKNFDYKRKKVTDDFIQMLCQRTGIYTGYGINHEDKTFKGTFELRSIVGDRAVHIHYTAVSLDGTDVNNPKTLYSKETVLFNEEETLVAYDSKNNLCLWSLNNNLGTTVVFDFRRHRYVRNEKNVFIFGFGNQKDNHFREEITIELFENGDIGYNYAWGQPDGMLLSQATVKMKKIS